LQTKSLSIFRNSYPLEVKVNRPIGLHI